MKYFLTVMLLLFAFFVKAQIVNIPDSNFKKFLLQHADGNFDGEIQQTEAIQVTALEFNGSDSIRDLTGIRSFINLRWMLGSFSTLTNLDLSGLANLEHINFNSQGPLIASADFNGCVNLNYIRINGLNLTSLTLNSPRLQFLEFNGGLPSLALPGCIDLKTLTIGGVTNLDISDCSNLETLDIQYSRLQSLSLDNNRKLKALSIYYNTAPDNSLISIANLDLRNCDSLSRLQLEKVKFLTVNISNLKILENLEIRFEADNLLAKNCTGLRSISSNFNSSKITNFLDVFGCNNLLSIDLTGFHYNGPDETLTSLDLSTCINLRVLKLGNILRELNLKNGSTLTQFEVDYPLDLRSVCADEFEIDALRAYFSQYRLDSLNISSYCSSFPGGNYNTIHGKARLDLNNNGCDSTDRGMPNVPLRISDNAGNSFIRYTASSGDYANYNGSGLFTLTPYFPYPYFAINPSSTTISFDTANNLESTANFCIQPNGVHNDLEITFLPVPWKPARPGFEAAYNLIYKNRGTTTLSGNVQVNFDNSKMNFASASTNITAQSTGQLSWTYSNLQPFESRTIDVNFNLLPPPVNNIGDTITYLAAITPNSNDETPFDNSFILPQRVRGAYDPNEKQCLEGSNIDISKIGDYLHYQIHFQNEGTDSAFNVVVTDTLSNKLDWNSFELINSSHPVSISNKNGKLEFVFENIQLPYKAINEPASNGYVAFKIKPRNTDLVGDSLNNKAAIYFDFNLPVITNTATTIITSSSPVPVKLEYFSITHKTTSNELNWKASCTFGNATFDIERSDDGIHFTSIGNITASNIRCQLPLSFTDNHPVAGKNYYRLKITDADGISFYSKTLVVGNNKSGFEITAISNSNIYFNSSKQQRIQLKILAADGKLVYADSKTITAGSSQISLPPMKHIATSIYTLVVYSDGGEVVTKKFLK